MSTVLTITRNAKNLEKGWFTRLRPAKTAQVLVDHNVQHLLILSLARMISYNKTCRNSGYPAIYSQAGTNLMTSGRQFLPDSTHLSNMHVHIIGNKTACRQVVFYKICPHKSRTLVNNCLQVGFFLYTICLQNEISAKNCLQAESSFFFRKSACKK